MRKSLDEDCTKILVNAFVTSTLDNGNSLLYGINKEYIHKLQVLQNSSARLIKKTCANMITSLILLRTYTGYQ